MVDKIIDFIYDGIEELLEAWDRQNFFVKIIILVVSGLGMLFILSNLVKIDNFSKPFYFCDSLLTIYLVLFYFTLKYLSFDTPIFFHFILLLLSAILPVLWFVYTNFLVSNILALIYLICVLIFIPKISYKNMIVFGIAIFFYDGIAVFKTNWMCEAIRKMAYDYIPVVIYIPNFTDIWGAPKCIIGLGDFIIPGVIIKSEIMRANENNLPKIFHLPLVPLVLFGGYCTGMVVGITMAVIFNHPQPLMIYIIPIMFCMLFVSLFLTGELKGLKQNFIQLK